MSVTRVQCYKTDDGQLFDTQAEAKKHDLERALRRVVGEDLGTATHEEIVAMLLDESSRLYSILQDFYGPTAREA